MGLLALLFFAALIIAFTGGQVQDMANKPEMPDSDDPKLQAEMRQASGTFDCLSMAVLIVAGAALLLFAAAGAGMGG